MNSGYNYLIYLEPYTFIFKGSYYVVYNTINSSYYKTKNNKIKEILDRLSLIENGYCIPINKMLSKEKVVIDFIRYIRRNYSGDIINYIDSYKENKPFIIPPQLRLYNDVSSIKNDKGLSLGEVILRNLSEVTIFLPGNCKNNCNDCFSYSKQFIHCFQYNGNDFLDYNEYTDMFVKLDSCGVSKLNIVINDFSNQTVKDILITRFANNLKKYFYFNILQLNDDVISLFNENDFLNIYIDNKFPINKLNILKNKTEKLKINWIYIVETSGDIERTEEDPNGSIMPFYNKNNLSFFEQYVYITYDDLLDQPINKQSIFRRQVLNENFFGKIYILPSGDIYSNLNSSCLGNIKNISFGQIIYNELSDSKVWLLTRESTQNSCNECANRFLCPSISNYELVLDKTDLCHIKVFK